MVYVGKRKILTKMYIYFYIKMGRISFLKRWVNFFFFFYKSYTLCPIKLFIGGAYLMSGILNYNFVNICV